MSPGKALCDFDLFGLHRFRPAHYVDSTPPTAAYPSIPAAWFLRTFRDRPVLDPPPRA